ncbi:MAG: hypothetical protein AUK39_05890 [Dehalococcoidia bacterium CG2_30_46_19]|nr:MAG: hypothetical protein AUK39_05890 [Dehalococcoidia bacterium CG2_30_46_19]
MTRGKGLAMTGEVGSQRHPFCHPDPEPFASCHSDPDAECNEEEGEESHTAQDRLREGEGSTGDSSVASLPQNDR